MVSAEGWVESCQDSAVRSCGHRDDFKLQDVIAHPSELVSPMDEDERLVERELGGCMLSRVTIPLTSRDTHEMHEYIIPFIFVAVTSEHGFMAI